MPKPSDAAGRMSTQGIEEGVTSVCDATNCTHPDLLLALVVFLLTAAALLLAGAVLVRLRNARDAVAAERRRTRAERDAFEQFRRRVSRLETTDPAPSDFDPPPGGGTGGTLVVGSSTSVDGGDLSAARRVYEETVMSTPHYAEEYDETLAESVAAEYNEAVANALVSGGTLTPALRTTLLRGAEDARDRRAKLLGDLHDETEAIETATDRLAPAVEAAGEVVETADEGASFSDLVADVERLDWHESRIESLVDDRQADIDDYDGDRTYWFPYLYTDLSSPHPVLSACAETLSRLDDARDAVAARIARN